jgi:hypothetical protein
VLHTEGNVLPRCHTAEITCEQFVSFIKRGERYPLSRMTVNIFSRKYRLLLNLGTRVTRQRRFYETGRPQYLRPRALRGIVCLLDHESLMTFRLRRQASKVVGQCHGFRTDQLSLAVRRRTIHSDEFLFGGLPTAKVPIPSWGLRRRDNRPFFSHPGIQTVTSSCAVAGR